MTITFDWDQTLTDYRIQQLAKKFVQSGMDVWVLTSRKEGQHNTDLFKILDKIGIPPQKIIFTGGRDKYQFVTAMNSDLHVDNSQYECNVINAYTNFVALCYSTRPTES